MVLKPLSRLCANLSCFITFKTYMVLKLCRMPHSRPCQLHHLQNLHGSQTGLSIVRIDAELHHLQNLHGSQTYGLWPYQRISASSPSKLTWFSNGPRRTFFCGTASSPSKLTWFSNPKFKKLGLHRTHHPGQVLKFFPALLNLLHICPYQ